MAINFPGGPVHGSTYDYNGVRYTFRKDGLDVGYWHITVPGSIEGVATAAEINEGLDPTKYVTPLELAGSNYVDRTISHTFSDNVVSNYGAGLDMKISSDGVSGLIDMRSGADLHFKDNGTTKLQWDSSADTWIAIADFRLQDDKILRMGNDSELAMYSDGSSLYMDLSSASDLYIRDGTSNIVWFDNSASLWNHYDHHLLRDSIDLRFGTGSDATISYEPSLSYVDSLQIRLDSTCDFIVMNNGSRALHYDNSGETFSIRNQANNSNGLLFDVSAGNAVISHSFVGQMIYRSVISNDTGVGIKFEERGIGGNRQVLGTVKHEVDGAYITLGWDGNTRLQTVWSGAHVTGKLECGGPVDGSLWAATFSSITSSTTYTDTIVFFNSAGTTNQGSIQTRNGAIPRFLAASDRRLKSNIELTPVDEAVARIKGIRVCDYEIFDNITKETSFGFVQGVIADEYEEFYPDGISVDATDPWKIKKVLDNVHGYDMVIALQDAMKKIEDLTERLDILGA